MMKEQYESILNSITETGCDFAEIKTSYLLIENVLFIGDLENES